jgi:hypothetical protein
MANALYPTFKEALLNKEHDLNTDIIMASLLDGADETYSATDNTYVAGTYGIADASKVAVTSLTSPTITTGTFDSANFTWSAVTGDVSEIILLWNNTHASDALIAWYDTSVTGLPVTPNGGDINVTVNGSGWFSL